MPLSFTLSAHGAGADLTGLDLLAVPVISTDHGPQLAPGVQALLDSHGATPELDEAHLARHEFVAKQGSTCVLSTAPGQPTVLLVGLGPAPTSESWRQAGAATARSLKGARGVVVVGDGEVAEAVAVGALLATYKFSLASKAEAPAPRSIEVLGADAEALARGVAIASAVGLARDLVNRPPADLGPTELAIQAAANLEGAGGVSVEIWDETRIEAERLGGLLGVAEGSVRPPRLVKATYEPDGPASGHVVLVGKGITFDSGGLSLKTPGGMTTMKTDMTGAAVVLSVMGALKSLGVTKKVTAIAPMAENMPSGTAMRPGDVLTTRSGTTIEVLNTDAEGRLILADGLTLAVEESPDLIVDVATLTGAAVVALGTGMAAMMTNDDTAAERFTEAAVSSGEDLWRLPLTEAYESHLDSEVADLKNIGAAGEAGTISAGLFLQRFVEKNPWVHLDIAGPGRSEKDTGLLTKGGTAYGVRLLLSYLTQ